MKRILIDLTEFQGWNGHFTGVQRVVYSIATNMSSEREVIFCSYSKNLKQLARDDISRYKFTSPEKNESGPRLSADNIRRLYTKIPGKLRRKLTNKQKQKLRSLAATVYRRAQLTSRTLKRRIPKTSNNSTDEILNPEIGDIIVLAGRLWDNPEYIRYLIEQKEHISGLRIATIIYDLIPIYHQHTFGKGLTEPYARYLFDMLSYADILFPISKSSARDLKTFATETGFYIPPKITVINLGDNINILDKKVMPNWLHAETQFGICVGTIEARKNHSLIYYAYKLATQKNIQLPPIFIIGKTGWLTDDILYAIRNDKDVNNMIEVVDNVDDEELAWLYEHASFTVYPSQYEGWGLPVAESLYYGTPCIASNTSSMPEIASPKLVDYISPFDPAELLKKIIYYTNPNNVSKKRQIIKRDYKPYSWAETIRTIISGIEDIS